MLPNVPYFGPIYYGILRAGGIVVPMNPLLKGREVKFYVEDPGAKLMFAWGDFEDAASQGAEEGGAELILVKPGEFEELVAGYEPDTDLAERADDDTAVLLYTSGTTGTPKGAELTHANLRTNARIAGGLFDISDEDVIFGGLPLFHSFGQTCALNAGMMAGATLTAPETVFLSFDAALGRDVLIEPHVVIGPGCTIEDGAVIRSFSHLEGARVASGVIVGPFARLRPGADIGAKARIGNFVEIKESAI